MARKRKELPILENITITDVAAEGKALAKVNDMVIFVPYVVPGDVVDLKIKKKKHRYCEAEAIKFHQYSEKRATPFCEHYGVCGGCKWQCLPYEEQIKYKQQQVWDNLSRIGKVELPEMLPATATNWSSAFPTSVGSQRRKSSRTPLSTPTTLWVSTLRDHSTKSCPSTSAG